MNVYRSIVVIIVHTEMINKTVYEQILIDLIHVRLQSAWLFHADSLFFHHIV